MHTPIPNARSLTIQEAQRDEVRTVNPSRLGFHKPELAADHVGRHAIDGIEREAVHLEQVFANQASAL